MQRFWRIVAVVWTLAACVALRFALEVEMPPQSESAALLAIPLVGVTLAVIPIPPRTRFAKDIQGGFHWAGLLMLTLFVVVGSASVGLIFLPSAVASFFVAR